MNAAALVLLGVNLMEDIMLRRVGALRLSRGFFGTLRVSDRHLDKPEEAIALATAYRDAGATELVHTQGVSGPDEYSRVVEFQGFLPAFFPLIQLLMQFQKNTSWNASMTRSAIVAIWRRLYIESVASSGKCS